MDRVPAMTTESKDKMLRVSPETHRQVHDLAARLGKSADETLAYLLGVSTLRVPVSDVLRQRWQEAADRAGQTLPDFIVARVEGAISYGGDRTGLQLVYEHVQALTKAAGVDPIPVNTPSTRARTRALPPFPPRVR